MISRQSVIMFVTSMETKSVLNVMPEDVSDPQTSADPSPHSLSILLPVLNEGINLRVMLKILRATVSVAHEVLVVCDTLDDDSIPVVEAMRPVYPNLAVVHNTLGRGVVNAIRAGVSAAQGDCILIFAADEVGPVLAIDDMLELMKS